MEQRRRIESIDALRGLAVLLMVVHHFFFDLVEFCGFPGWLFSNPAFDVLHYLFAGLFILLSGVSSDFSRSNLKRGLKAFALAMGITLVTGLIDMPVRFGVLHLLGFCMIFYGVTARIWDAIPRKLAPLLYLLGLLLTAPLVSGQPTQSTWLWPLGWVYPGFYSSDYFPILPWVFVFLFGTWLGKHIREERFPTWFYTLRAPFLAAVGRRALWIYLLHQPLLYGLTLLLQRFVLGG